MKRYHLGLFSLFLVFSLILGNISLSFAQKVPSPNFYNTPADYQKATGKRIVKFGESPMLTNLVKQNKLLPIEKRLPKDPLVVVPVEEVGEYGGQVNLFTASPNNLGEADYFTGYEHILGIATDGSTVTPRIARTWKFTDGGKTLTIYLRRGIRWSDGEPFTADDIMFWYEDIILNDELTPVKPIEWSPGGKLMKVEKVDDYTVRLRFAIPYPVAIYRLAHETGAIYRPKHFLKQFHPKYTSIEEINKMAKAEGFDKWYQLFGKYNTINATEVNCPTLRSFVLTKRGTDFLVLERNPYYWQIDTAGNQLPYIDRVFISVVQNTEVMDMKVISGEADFAGRRTTLENYTLYKENEKKGNYRVLLWQGLWGSDVIIEINQTYKEDPVLRDIFRDVRFRKAMSLAINRNEVNQMLYFGLGVPRQTTVIPQSPYYEESFAKAYIEYNPQEANKLLDEMGLKKGSDGYRIRPDGKRLEILLEYTPEAIRGKIAEMLIHYWDAIGVKVAAKEISNELQRSRAMGGLIQMGFWSGDRCAFLFPLQPYWWVPMDYDWENTWCPLWAQWYATKGKSGEEPPKEVKTLLTLWEKMQTTLSDKERIRLGKEILKSNAENLWTIGIAGLAPQPIIAKNYLRNIPEKGLWGYDNLRTYPYFPSQIFIKK
ncbi:MAG TPA: ABC transporter substrate-binding protein [bacterium]|nr:ABC transporter substrate-binding protein [bacterium]HPO81694.1 ABC transporter substrate-binding protein [bacterium]